MGQVAGDERWTQVATASSQMEAEMLRDLLTSEGIASVVQTSDASAYLGVISPCKLMVRQDDKDRAATFLDAWETSSPLEEDLVGDDDDGLE